MERSGSTSISDEELMMRAMRGNREALGVLVERYYSLLLGYLYRLVGGDRPLAEDLAQETFLRLFQRGGYASGRPFRPWFYAIATNLVRDHVKSAVARHSAQHEGEEALLALRDEAPGPEEHAVAAEEADEVARALSCLGSEYREVILLRFYQGLSLNEIAEILGIPLGTVKSRLSVGTRRLRTLFCRMRERTPQ